MLCKANFYFALGNHIKSYREIQTEAAFDAGGIEARGMLRGWFLHDIGAFPEVKIFGAEKNASTRVAYNNFLMGKEVFQIYHLFKYF